MTISTTLNDLNRPILSWTPTVTASGSMTFGTITTSVCYYWQLEKRLFFSMHIRGTTGGTASTSLIATLPFSAISTNFGGGSCVLIGGTRTGGTWELETVDKIYISKYDVSNFTLAANNGFKASGWYYVG